MADWPEEMKRTSWIGQVMPYDLEPIDTKGAHTKKLFVTPQHLSIDDLNLETTRITLPPLPHQRMTIAAMWELEQTQSRRVTIAGPEANNMSGFTVETRAGVLSERPGSGKTIEILYLIALNTQPHKKPEITSFNIPTATSHRSDSYRNIGFATEVRRTYRTILKPALIFVGKSVLIQWMDTIQTYTDFKVLMIDNIFALREFYDTWKTHPRRLQKYDIVLVKNGNIAGKFDAEEFEGTSLAATKSRPIITVFGEIFKNVCWRWVFLDDFDNLSIPSKARCIPALFTWFVSATKKRATIGRAIERIYGNRHLLTSYRPYYVQTWANRELFTFFNVGCENDFINASTSATLVYYYFYRFRNTNEKYVNLIGAIQTETTDKIIEALNSDAIGAAAEAAGINTRRVVVIFGKMLGKSWKMHRRALNVAEHIRQVRCYVETLPMASNTKKGIDQHDMDIFKRNIKSCGSMAEVRRLVKYNQSLVGAALQEAEEENNRIKEETGKSIQRVRENLRHGECPISMEPLSELQSIVIMRCCGAILSGDVVKRSLALKREDGDVTGACPYCRRAVRFRDLIYVEKDNIEFEDILDDNILQEEEEERDIPNPKYDCIVKIIRNEEIQEKVMTDTYRINNLLEGHIDKAEAAAEDMKILIFANYTETMKLIEKKLIFNAIPYLKVQGTPVQIREAIERYHLPNDDEESINVLLIAGAKYCAGLNLQITTDLIFTGKILDAHVEQQLAGRCCRIGRTNNLRVHYVLYENEFKLETE